MPSHEYPDGINLYIPAAVKQYLVQHGITTPVIAAGKIATRALAESVIESGQADIIGMARGLLADPDLPRKWRAGEDATVVRCIYCNVCKNLDENFREVRCFLWPRGSQHAPEGQRWGLPAWPAGAGLTAVRRGDAIRLEWRPADAEAGVQGYDIFRSSDGKHWERIWAGQMVGYTDHGATAGHTWRYMVQAYDRAGTRSALSEVAEVEVPMPDFALSL